MAHVLILYYIVVIGMMGVHFARIRQLYRLYALPILRDYGVFITAFSFIIFISSFNAYVSANILVSPAISTWMQKIQYLASASLIFWIPFFLHRLLELAYRRYRDIFFSVLSMAAMLAILLNFSVLTMACFLVMLIYGLSLKVLVPSGSIPQLHERAATAIFYLSVACTPLFLGDIFSPFLNSIIPSGLLLTSIYYVVWTVMFLFRSLPFLDHRVSVANCCQQFSDLYRLTERESSLLPHIIAGCSNTEIGERLFITEITVKKHLQRIFEKSDSKNKVMLVQKIMSFAIKT